MLEYIATPSFFPPLKERDPYTLSDGILYIYDYVISAPAPIICFDDDRSNLPSIITNDGRFLQYYNSEEWSEVVFPSTALPLLHRAQFVITTDGELFCSDTLQLIHLPTVVIDIKWVESGYFAVTDTGTIWSSSYSDPLLFTQVNIPYVVTDIVVIPYPESVLIKVKGKTSPDYAITIEKVECLVVTA